MIHFVTGKPRAGKSKFAMKTIHDWLRSHPTCPIVTNMAIRLEPWNLGTMPQRGLKNWYYFKHLEELNTRRIKILQDDEAANFFIHRWDANGNWIVLEHSMRNDQATAVNWDQARQTRPCLYLLDECNRYWDSRQWHQRVHSDVLKYAPLNGQLADEVYLLTQHKDLVDVGFRRLAQDYMELRNMRFEKFLTFWKQPDKIRFWVSQDESFKIITEKGVLHVPPGLTHCYNTAGGVGTRSDGLYGADQSLTFKRKGLPLWSLIAAGAAIIVACTFLPKIAASIGRKLSVARVSHPQPPSHVTVHEPKPPAPTNSVARTTPQAPAKPAPEPIIANAAFTGPRIELWTTTGEKYDTKKDAIARLGDYFIVQNRLLSFAPTILPKADDRDAPPAAVSSPPQHRRQIPFPTTRPGT